MAITHWIITNMEGELVGQYSQLMVGSRKSFDDCEPPTGYKKTELSYDEFEKINSSFNRDRRIYQKFINPVTSRAKELSESKKEIHEARAKPNKYRERINSAGNMVKEFYDKDGNLDRTEIVDKDGNPVVPA